MKRFFRYVPKKDIRKLRIVFSLPSQEKEYLRKSVRYLSHLIGHEGAGSIHQTLQTLGWSTSLTAGELQQASDFFLFGITFSLTPLGEEKVNEIFQIVFSYIQCLKESGCPEWIYDECHNINEVSFRFSHTKKPEGHVTSVTEAMKRGFGIEPKYFLKEDHLLEEYDQQDILSLLDCFRPENALVFFASKKFQGQTDLVEPWFGTSYSVVDVSEEDIVCWKQDTEHKGALHLPGVNQFIPTRFEVLGTKAETPSLPAKIRDDEQCTIWYKLDDTFLQPKVCLFFQVRTPVVSESPLSVLLSQLYIQMVQELLSEVTYDAYLSELDFQLDAPTDGVQINIYGFYQSLEKMVEMILQKLLSFQIDQNDTLMMGVFKKQLDILLRKYENYERSQAYEIARWSYQGCTYKSPPIDERMKVFHCRYLSPLAS
jgi:insulysin